MICEECGGTGEELVELEGFALVAPCLACAGTGLQLSEDDYDELLNGDPDSNETVS